MENPKQENKSNENQNDIDKLPFEIETVTPDTEKDVVPTVDTKKDKELENQETTATQKEDQTEALADSKEIPAEDTTSEEPSEKEETATEHLEAESTDEAVPEETEDKIKSEDSVPSETDDNASDDTSTEDGSIKKEGNDERDQIETVSP